SARPIQAARLGPGLKIVVSTITSACARVLFLVVDAERVDRFVHERADPPVGALAGVNDDLAGVGVAPPAGGARDRLDPDRVPSVAGEPGQRGDQVLARVAAERLAWGASG